MNNAAKSIYLRWLSKLQLCLLFCSVVGFIAYIPAAKAELQVRGIYIMQITLQNTKFITHIIERSKKAGEKGKKVTFSGTIPVSKVMLIDPSSGSSSRVGYTFLENGSKQRIAKASGKSV